MATTATRLGASIDHQRAWDLGYELLELTGSGAYCDVWRVRHRETCEVFLWKQLRPEWEHEPAARASLENEAAVGQLVRSPLLPRLVEAHVAERPRYAIWECFEGRSVEYLWREYRSLPIRSALWIARQCVQGLEDLLRGGLVHGDLSPANVLVSTRTGLVKLTELGASRRVPMSAGSVALNETPRPHFRASGPAGDYNSVVSPPHLQGVSKDLYQVGIILFRSLAGRMPFEGETAADMLRGRQTNLADDLRRVRPEISTALAEVVRDLLSDQSQRRFNHPAELVVRLMEFELDELVKCA